MKITRNQLISIFLAAAIGVWLDLEFQYDHFSPVFNFADVHHETFVIALIFGAIIIYLFGKKRVNV